MAWYLKGAIVGGSMQVAQEVGREVREMDHPKQSVYENTITKP